MERERELFNEFMLSLKNNSTWETRTQIATTLHSCNSISRERSLPCLECKTNLTQIQSRRGGFIYQIELFDD